MESLTSLSEKQYRELVLQLLLRIIIDQDATWDLFVGEYLRHSKEDIKQLNEALKELRLAAEKDLIAQLKNKYGLGDIDSLLNSAF